MTSILNKALTPRSAVELTKNLMESILVIIGRVATSPMASAPMRNKAHALADQMLVGIAKQLQPGRAIPLDTTVVQAVVAHSTPDKVLNRKGCFVSFVCCGSPAFSSCFLILLTAASSLQCYGTLQSL